MGEQVDFPIEIRADDLSLSLRGDLLVTGPAAERVRRLFINYPVAYRRYVVPYLQHFEASFQPDELWIDPAGRIHISNRKVVQRMRRHLPAAPRRANAVED